MKNDVYFITKAQADAVKNSLDCSTYIAEMDGRTIQTEDDYLKQAWFKFKFPYPNEKSKWAGYDDWICDMSWVDASGFALFIYDAIEFMRDKSEQKEYFVLHHRDFILPFWEDEVTRVFVDGKAKPFKIYLVE